MIEQYEKEVGDPQVDPEVLARAQAIVQWPKWVRKGHVDHIKSLRCFENVRELCEAGLPAAEIARQIHLFGESKDVVQSTLAQYVDHYKAIIPRHRMIQKINPHFNALQKKAVEEVDVKGGLADLYKMMHERCSIAINRERQVGFLLPNVEKSFQVALTYLQAIANLQEKGFSSEAEQARAISREIDWDRIYVRPGVSKVLQDPTARARVVRFVENMTSLFGGMPEEKQKEILEHVKRKKEIENSVIEVQTEAK